MTQTHKNLQNYHGLTKVTFIMVHALLVKSIHPPTLVELSFNFI